MRRILIFLPNWIGDVVMATPAIRAVHQSFPQAQLTAVCRGYVADTLAGAPWFQDTVLYDKSGPAKRRLWGVIKRLHEQQPEAAVLFPNSFRSALMARLAGCRQVVGFARYGRDFLLSRRLYPARDDRGRPRPVPVIDDYNRIVRLLGVPDPGHRMELFTTPADEAAADAFWQQHNLEGREVIALNSGGAFGAAKHWPTGHFAELARALTERRGASLVVLCGPSERDLARRIVEEARHPAVTSLADSPMSLGLTKAVVRRSRLLITTDSGPRHFAAAFDRPVISLFGPTHIAWTETYFRKAVHMQKSVPCGPCQLRICPLDHRCMTTLLPGEVLAAAESLLRRDPA